MPSESPNFILRGSRFATIGVSLPIRSSGLYADLMPANTVRVGTFDHHVPRQVRDLRAVLAVAEVRHRERLVEREFRAVDRGDEPLFSERFGLRPRA